MPLPSVKNFNRANRIKSFLRPEVDSVRGEATEIIAQQLGLSLIVPRKAICYSRIVGGNDVNLVRATSKAERI
jgi:hypothetical protein